MQALKNEQEWAEITQKRLRRYKVSKDAFLAHGERTIEADSLGKWLQFVKRYGLPVMHDPALSFEMRVRLAGYTAILAVRAKDEAEFLTFVNEEVRSAANSLGIVLP